MAPSSTSTTSSSSTSTTTPSQPHSNFNSTPLSSLLTPHLRPFQTSAVKLALLPPYSGRLLLGDEMGLGKTLTSLTIMSHYYDEWPLLVICPSSLRYNWPSEIERFAPSLPFGSIHVVDGFSDTSWSVQLKNANPPTYICKPNIKILVLSYSLLRDPKASDKVSTLTNLLRRLTFRTIIIDESHHLKTRSSQKTSACMSLVKRATRLVLLSGTPAVSRPVELYTQLSMLNLRLFGSYTAFTKRYCNAHQGRFGVDVKGCSNVNELNGKIKEVMIRRLKKDVLSDLPDKVRQVVVVKMAGGKERKECVQVMKELKEARAGIELMSNDYDDGGGGDDSSRGADIEARRLLMKAYQLSGIGKASASAEYIEEWLDSTADDDNNNKVLVFAHHKQVLYVIEQRVCKKLKGLKGYIRIDGSVNAKDRLLAVKKFQNESTCRVAVLSLTAAGTGLTLTAASTVIFAELHWAPGSILQAEDRVHRIGQKNHVTIMFLLCDETECSVDMMVFGMLSKKMRNVGRIVDGGEGGRKEGGFNANHSASSSSSSSSGRKSGEGGLSDFLADVQGGKKNVEAPKRMPVAVRGSLHSFFGAKGGGEVTSVSASSSSSSSTLISGSGSGGSSIFKTSYVAKKPEKATKGKKKPKKEKLEVVDVIELGDDDDDDDYEDENVEDKKDGIFLLNDGEDVDEDSDGGDWQEVVKEENVDDEDDEEDDDEENESSEEEEDYGDEEDWAYIHEDVSIKPDPGEFDDDDDDDGGDDDYDDDDKPHEPQDVRAIKMLHPPPSTSTSSSSTSNSSTSSSSSKQKQSSTSSSSTSSSSSKSKSHPSKNNNTNLPPLDIIEMITFSCTTCTFVNTRPKSSAVDDRMVCEICDASNRNNGGNGNSGGGGVVVRNANVKHDNKYDDDDDEDDDEDNSLKSPPTPPSKPPLPTPNTNTNPSNTSTPSLSFPSPRKTPTHKPILSFLISSNSGRVAHFSADGRVNYCFNLGIDDVTFESSTVGSIGGSSGGGGYCYNEVALISAMKTVKANATNLAITSSTTSSTSTSTSITSTTTTPPNPSTSTSTMRIDHMVSELKHFLSEWSLLHELDKSTIIKSGTLSRGNTVRRIAAEAMEKEKTVGGMKPVYGRYLDPAYNHDNHNNSSNGNDDGSNRDGKGIGICKWCGTQSPLLLTSTRAFCSKSCAENSRLRNGGIFASSKIRAQVFALEHGICQICKCDAHALYKRICALQPAERLNCLLNTNNFKLPMARVSVDRLLSKPTASDFWQADHIIPVVEGGGGCGLDNLRTLCTCCHGKETGRLLGRVKLNGLGGGGGGVKGGEDIREVFGRVIGKRKGGEGGGSQGGENVEEERVEKEEATKTKMKKKRVRCAD